jgi:hypothetical protein
MDGTTPHVKVGKTHGIRIHRPGSGVPVTITGLRGLRVEITDDSIRFTAKGKTTIRRGRKRD